MANTTRRFKLEYNDNTGTTQTIAELGQDTGAVPIDRIGHYRKTSNPDVLKLWFQGDNFGKNIPTRNSEYGQAQNGTDEPEILYKQYNPDTDSFDTINRFQVKNAGSVDDEGRQAVKLRSFMQYLASQQINITSISDTNGNGKIDVEDAMNAVLPDGYVADVPSGADPPEIGSYSKIGRREDAFKELTDDYDWALTFTSELDANNNYKVKYEPESFGGTVDTLVSNEQSQSHRIIAVDTTNDIFTVPGDQTDSLVVNQSIEVVQSTGNDGTYTINTLSYDSNNNQTDITVDENISDTTADGLINPGGLAIFKSWEKEKTGSIVNKVKVVGVDKDNPDVEIEATATNDFMINEFGERFQQIKVGYLSSQAHAQTIAESYLVPGLDENGDDIEEVPENGTVKTRVYSDNVVNDSFQVIDNTRNIDDTYFCKQQRNYWPEGATEIEFEFEQEKLEEAANGRENLRDERARTYPASQTDVGGQTIDTNQSNTTTSLTDVTASDFGDTFDTSPIIDSGRSTAETLPLVSENVNDSGFTLNDGESNTISTSISYQGGLMFVDATLQLSTATPEQKFAISIQLSGFTVKSGTFETDNGGEINMAVPIPGNQSGLTVEFIVANRTGGQVGINLQDMNLNGENGHTHGPDTYQSLDHNHGASISDDPGHGDTTDSSTHNLEGQTEDGQNINVSQENKTDR